jgi:hypothetical protein
MEMCNQRSFIQLQGVAASIKQTQVTYDNINAIFVLFIGSIIYKFTILSFSMCVNETHVRHATCNRNYGAHVHCLLFLFSSTLLQAKVLIN